jgi:PhzF family phenazine biosynthesis protein
MTRSYDYRVVDVFTARPMLGNPVAVVLGAEGLDTDEMQAIARWINLSETTFVLSQTTAEADYRLRIFTPRSELPFTGHPTLGSAHAVLEAGAVTLRQGGRLVQECGTGLVELRITDTLDGRRLTFELPPAKLAPLDVADAAELEHILGCAVSARVAPAIVDVGPVWMVVQVPDAATVLGLQPDFARLAALERHLGATGITVFGAHAQGEAAIEVRTFAPSCGIDEDPVCGSGNGSVAAFQWARGLLPPGGGSYVAAQGRCVGRDGRIRVDVTADGKVHVGGSCVTCVQGALRA